MFHSRIIQTVSTVCWLGQANVLSLKIKLNISQVTLQCMKPWVRNGNYIFTWLAVTTCPHSSTIWSEFEDNNNNFIMLYSMLRLATLSNAGEWSKTPISKNKIKHQIKMRLYPRFKGQLCHMPTSWLADKVLMMESSVLPDILWWHYQNQTKWSYEMSFVLLGEQFSENNFFVAC